MMEGAQLKHHFVLVHGVCHGAWCWYKVVTILESAGHRVTALDMAACGSRPGRAEEVATFEEYSRPLLDTVAALPPEEKVVLVGHSFGGQSLALAMERCPDKVAVAVFVSAAMPAAGKPMIFVFEEFSQETGPDFLMDCTHRTSSDPRIQWRHFCSDHSTWLGDCISSALLRYVDMCGRLLLYFLSGSALQDLTLARAMVRPSRRFLNDAVMEGMVLTAERYGAVSRVYIVAEDDASWSDQFQRRMASWNPGTEVKALQGADHMPMFSKPRELAESLMDIIADEHI